MRFSKTSEYAIRVLTFMAYDETKVYSANFLHEELGLPYRYLTKLMTELSKKKLVQRVRGREGGFCIKKKLSQITVKDIVHAVDENMDFKRCILGFDKCSDDSPCSMHKYWEKHKKQINKMAESVSLDDLRKSKTVKL
ncbi:MAG: Rrf2 family transcriptional regulator [Bdellovibrionaceae bacterium]|jgi:Rrf2 family transcriptional regulator, iron-sulfur cluster assembly transcription factor|nr:Rrf2 family transcriptional regulator [Pseudobdellovibrionaceae bacterium]